jgi:type II secretory pathway component PulK
MMKTHYRQSGSVMMMTVFVIALLSTLVMGILEMNTVDIQIMQNHVAAVEAQMMAQTGLNHALSELREDAGWSDGFTNQAWNNGTYTVAVSGTQITVTGTTAQGFSAELVADVTVSASGPPYTVRLDTLRINQ